MFDVDVGDVLDDVFEGGLVLEGRRFQDRLQDLALDSRHLLSRFFREFRFLDFSTGSLPILPDQNMGGKPALCKEAEEEEEDEKKKKKKRKTTRRKSRGRR